MKTRYYNILLVEDEAVIALNQKKQLEKHGYEVIHSLNGKAAVEIIKKSETKIDLILMDIHMPELDGYQTSSYISSKNEIPILGISSDFKNNITATTFGMRKMLSKHIKPKELLREIDLNIHYCVA